MKQQISYKVLENGTPVIDYLGPSIYLNNEYKFTYKGNIHIVNFTLSRVIITISGNSKQVLYFTHDSSYSVITINNNDLRLNIKLIDMISNSNTVYIKYYLIDDPSIIREIILNNN